MRRSWVRGSYPRILRERWRPAKGRNYVAVVWPLSQMTSLQPAGCTERTSLDLNLKIWVFRQIVVFIHFLIVAKVVKSLRNLARPSSPPACLIRQSDRCAHVPENAKLFQLTVVWAKTADRPRDKNGKMARWLNGWMPGKPEKLSTFPGGVEMRQYIWRQSRFHLARGAY